MAGAIEEVIGYTYRGLQLDYSREKIPLGTAGAVKLAGQVVDTEHCFVMNGDSYTKFDLVSLYMFHKQENANITLLAKMVDNTTRFGTIQMNERNEIEKFMEKKPKADSGLVNAGVYIMKTSVFKEIPDKIPCSLEYDFFPSMIGQGIFGFKTKGKFIDIGTPKSYTKAKALLEQPSVLS